ncbi:MAG: XRE family transcriptional regulator [Flavobacterium psychrophilum]|nr:MAG: XRE family transcriptional regulator [Flavobacterium psychrophilum]
METIGKKIADIRKQKGLTQEEVSERAMINLRTLQRIEKGETDPRGNSLKGICEALGINIEDIVDYGKMEDRNYLMFLHLSVMSFVIIPFGNIILPLILWLNKRDKVKNVNKQGTNILNYQLLWTVVSNALLITGAYIKINHFPNAGNFIIAFFILCGLNFIYPIYAAIRISKGKVRSYYPAILKIIK